MYRAVFFCNLNQDVMKRETLIWKTNNRHKFMFWWGWIAKNPRNCTGSHEVLQMEIISSFIFIGNNLIEFLHSVSFTSLAVRPKTFLPREIGQNFELWKISNCSIRQVVIDATTKNADFPIKMYPAASFCI